MKSHQAVLCNGWTCLNAQEPPPDIEAPPRNVWTVKNVQTQTERLGRNLKGEDNGNGGLVRDAFKLGKKCFLEKIFRQQKLHRADIIVFTVY